MEKELKNKTVVVTGGAMGIGYQIADYFLQNEARIIIILDINESVGIEAAKTLNQSHGEGKAVYIKCDVTKDLERVSNEIFEKYKVDVLVNNAGIADEANLRKTIEINTIAVVEWGMKFWDKMRKDNGGSGGTIFNIASIYGYEYDPWAIYYKTSKHGVMGFSKTLGHPFNYNKTGVRVIAFCPGFTGTDILNGNFFEYHEKDFKEFLSHQVIQKVETVGQAAVDIFKVAESGSAWEARDDKPIRQVPTI